MAEVSFSKAQHFSNLDPNPGQPEPRSLKWELENDATLQASLVTVPAGIQTRIIGSDVVATMEFFVNGAATDWGSMGAPDQAAVLAVLDSHEGLPISADSQSQAKPSATATPGHATDYTEVMSFETAPLQDGTYEFVFDCNARLTAAPASFEDDYLQIRVQFTDGEGTTNTRSQAIVRGSQMDCRTLKRSFSARDGEVVTIALEAKGNKVGVDGSVTRVEGVVRPV